MVSIYTSIPTTFNTYYIKPYSQFPFRCKQPPCAARKGFWTPFPARLPATVTLHPPFPALDGDSAWLATVTSYAAEISPARWVGYQAEEQEQGELIVQWLVPNFTLDEPKG
ncbi:hypothetical protein Taro_051248 [Colocasia esculenta]|uniref:Uncharacterized protein n=1 Tax=Colocasia esculenta TaxID=4460 RepID=A0A843XFG7_COLES|nr:hypothetical protein [Colocasia esculenta]